MSGINVIGEYKIGVHMFIVPRVKKVHFTNLEDSDEESSETYKKMTKLIETKEIDILMNIYISKINGKSYIGIEFQNGKIIYRKAEILTYKQITIYRDTANMAFIPQENKLTLCAMERCHRCRSMFKKVYRCFDCHPSEDEKKKQKYDFCKACYKFRDHTNHRVISLILDVDILDKYPILED